MSSNKHRPVSVQHKSNLPVPAQPALRPIPDQAQELSIFNEDNPYSLINLVPKAFRPFLKAIDIKLLAMTEVDFNAKHAPDEVDCRLKLKFWDEWQQVILAPDGVQIRLPAVYYGVCTAEYFYEKIIKDPIKLAWMIMPPADYEIICREILYKGTARLREIIQLPFVQEMPIIVRGRPVMDPAHPSKVLTVKKIDRGLISEIRQTVAQLSDRVHGAIVQRMEIQQKILSMSVSGDMSDPVARDALQGLQREEAILIPADDLAVLDQNIAAIKAKLGPVADDTLIDQVEKTFEQENAEKYREAGGPPDWVDGPDAEK